MPFFFKWLETDMLIFQKVWNANWVLNFYSWSECSVSGPLWGKEGGYWPNLHYTPGLTFYFLSLCSKKTEVVKCCLCMQMLRPGDQVPSGCNAPPLSRIVKPLVNHAFNYCHVLLVFQTAIKHDFLCNYLAALYEHFYFLESLKVFWGTI